MNFVPYEKNKPKEIFGTKISIYMKNLHYKAEKRLFTKNHF